MIQRIQSIYLLLAAILLCCTIILPLSQIDDPSNQSIITIYALKSVSTNSINQPITVLSNGIVLGLSIILGLLCIFLYKKRQLQMVICSLLIFFTFVSGNLIVANNYMLRPSSHAIMSFNFVSIFPVISLILFFLAHRAIKKDDKLVKSLDRIR